jgi:hypothetical protein
MSKEPLKSSNDVSPIKTVVSYRRSYSDSSQQAQASTMMKPGEEGWTHEWGWNKNNNNNIQVFTRQSFPIPALFCIDQHSSPIKPLFPRYIGTFATALTWLGVVGGALVQLFSSFSG